VTDANACTSSQQVTIDGVKINDNGNCGFCADMCGGCAPYSYVWSNGATSQCIICLTTGTYTVTVTDCSGKTFSCSKSIVVNPLTAQLIGPQQSTNTIDIVVQGGCLPFTCTYDINGGAPQSLPQSLNPITTFNIPNYVSNDFYRVYISDYCGNTIPTFQFFAREGVNGAVQSNMPTPVLKPNPNNGIFHIEFNEQWLNTNVEIKVLDMTGKTVYSENKIVENSLSLQMNLSNLSKGVYMISYKSNNQNQNAKFIVQ
jgi:hypothetical protein